MKGLVINLIELSLRTPLLQKFEKHVSTENRFSNTKFVMLRQKLNANVLLSQI